MRLSGTALLMGRLRAESLNLVDAELAVRIAPDGQVTVSAGDTAKPLATGVASKRGAAALRAHDSRAHAAGTAPRHAARRARDGAERIAGRPRLARQPEPDRSRRAKSQRDRPEERQSGRRRPAARQQMDVRQYQHEPSPAERRWRCAQRGRGGRRAVVAAGGDRPADQRRALGRSPRRQGSDGQYPAGDAGQGPHLQRGPAAVGRTERRTRPRRPADLFPRQAHRRCRPHHRQRYARLSDGDRSAEINVEWDSGRRVLVAPFKIVSGANRVTLLAHLEPPNGTIDRMAARLERRHHRAGR